MPTTARLTCRLTILWLVAVLGAGYDDPSPVLFPVSQGKKWGFMNATGEIVIEPQFASAGMFVDGVARVSWKWKDHGLIDAEGNVLVRGVPNIVLDVSEGFVVYSDPGSEDGGVIDRRGKQTAIAGVVSFSQVREGRVQIKRDDRYGFADLKGNVVVPCEYDVVMNFSDGLAAVTKEKKAWFIDREGQRAFDGTFENAGSFRNGLAPVQTGGSWTFIDREGKVAMEKTLPWLGRFSEEGLAPYAAADRKQGYVDRTGKVVIEARFKRCFPFHEGRAAVLVGEKYGYIDTSGNFVIEPISEVALPYQNGLVRIMTGTFPHYANGYADRDGKWIWKPSR